MSMHIDPGKFGRNVRVDWRDGEPLPEALNDAQVVQLTADGRELELIVHALNGDAEMNAYARAHTNPPGTIPLPVPAGIGRALPRFVQLVPMGETTLCALDADGGAWFLEPVAREWHRLEVFA